MPGEAISVEGESGSGMSMLLRRLLELSEADWQAIKYPHEDDRARKNTRTLWGVNATK